MKKPGYLPYQSLTYAKIRNEMIYFQPEKNLRCLQELENKLKKLESKGFLKDLKDRVERVKNNINNELGREFLDNEGRIIIPPADQGVLDKVAKLERKFKEQETRKNILKELGEILELFKFVKINEEKTKFITLRTSLYDDFTNHIDEIIYFRETFEPVMAIDITTTSEEDIQVKKIARFIEILNKGGGIVRYGLIIQKDDQNRLSSKRSELSGIPIFIVHMHAGDLLEIIVKEKTEENKFNFSDWLDNLLKTQVDQIIKVIGYQINIADREHQEKLNKLQEEYKAIKEKLFQHRS